MPGHDGSPRHGGPTGPRKARPDDRLREAIQCPSFRGAATAASPESITPIVSMDSGLSLREPRNDSVQAWIASSLALLAMTRHTRA
jgi:hypothetical protein